MAQGVVARCRDALLEAGGVQVESGKWDYDPLSYVKVRATTRDFRALRGGGMQNDQPMVAC